MALVQPMIVQYLFKSMYKHEMIDQERILTALHEKSTYLLDNARKLGKVLV